MNVPILSGHCEVAQRIAERLGLPPELRESLGQIYERWDGRGLPKGLSGEAVKFPVRLVTLAQDAIALTEAHGFAPASGPTTRSRDGSQPAARGDETRNLAHPSRGGYRGLLRKSNGYFELVAEPSTHSPKPAPSVDSRLLQANERTLLAWVRTGLGLLAFGFVLERVDGWLGSVAPSGGAVARPVGTAWIGVVFVVLGLLANALAVLRFIRSRRALQTGAPLPMDVLPVAFAAAITVLSAALGIYVIVKLV